jgi:hypothetical protein
MRLFCFEACFEACQAVNLSHIRLQKGKKYENQTISNPHGLEQNQPPARSTGPCSLGDRPVRSGRGRAGWWRRCRPLILLVAVFTGWLAGLLYARWQKRTWTIPQVRFAWLVIIGFLPQFFAFYLPATRDRMPDAWVAASLLVSDILFLVFCWFNRHLAGVWLLGGGAALNLIVIASNGGFMPISPQTASHLIPPTLLETLPVGGRFGAGKDILLLPEHTRFVWLSDRFLLPNWFPYQVAFSLGDILIACGAFWLMATQGKPPLHSNEKA